MGIPYEELEFKILQPTHNILDFWCSEIELNSFLRENALYYQQYCLASTHLVFFEGSLVGYYTLVNDCIETKYIPVDERDAVFIHEKYPAMKIARFAVHENFEDMDIGTSMLDRIFAIAIRTSRYVGCRIITVDAKRCAEGERRTPVGYYQKFGFKIAQKKIKDTSETIPMYRDFYKTKEEILRAQRTIGSFDK